MLSTLARDAIKLCRGQFQLTSVEGDHGLNGTLAKGLTTQNQSPTVILHGTSENLRRGRGETIDQNSHRPVINHRVVVIAVNGRPAATGFHLHGRARGYEQGSQRVGFL